jgi:hypothetical protein
LAWIHVRGKYVRVLSSSDLPDHVQGCWKLRQIAGAYGIAVAGRAWERREIAVGHDRVSQHTAGGGKQVDSFRYARGFRSMESDPAGLFLNDAACIFEAEHGRRIGLRSHAHIIRPSRLARSM